MARKPATKKGTETVTDTTATAAAPAAAASAPAPAEAPAPAPAPAPAAAPAAEGGVAWGANPEPAVADTFNYDLLRKIVDATTANSFVYLGTDETQELVSGGFAEVNPGMVDDYGAVATRATTQGISKMTEQTAPAAAANPAPAPAATNTAGDPAAQPQATATAAPKIFKASDFADIFAAPVKRSNSGRSSSYPFDDLEVDGFFFVPATAKMPDPKKSLASTISSAERRFATDDKNEDGSPKMRTMKVAGVEKTVQSYTKTREFESRSIDDGAPFGYPGTKGAVVRRIK